MANKRHVVHIIRKSLRKALELVLHHGGHRLVELL